MSGLSADAVTAALMAAKQGVGGTVPIDPPPRDEAEHRRRLAAFRGYRP